MRVDKVDKKHRTAIINYNNEAEIDLINESMDILIQKQQKMLGRQAVDGHGRLHEEPEERQKLERFKKSKDRAVEMPKMMKRKGKEKREEMKDRIKRKGVVAAGAGVGKPDRDENNEQQQEQDIEDTEEFKRIERMRRESDDPALTGEVEITCQNIHDIVNALNEHIVKLEKDGTHQTTQKEKYDKLVKMLENAQNQKSLFDRVTPKPRGFGRLRK